MFAQNAYDVAIRQVQQEYLDVQDGKTLFEKIKEKLSDTYSNPPTSEFETILRKNFSVDEVRVALFQPLEEQARYYPVLLNAAISVPTGHQIERCIKSVILPLLYLVHRKSWAFLVDFTVTGGLEVLVSMLDERNLYFRGQVMEVIMSITDCDTFDWFKPPDGDITSLALHHAMLSLTEHSTFLPKLFSNRISSYPGGSFRALQLLAFWLSWLRAMKTKDQVLRLSSQLLEEIRLWGEAESSDSIPAEEAELARTLYKDFGHDQFQRENVQAAADIVSTNTVSDRTLSVSGLVSTNEISFRKLPAFPYDTISAVDKTEKCSSSKDLADKEEEKDNSSDIQTPSPASLLAAVMKVKEQGNSSYRDGNYEESIGFYTEAIAGVEELIGTTTTRSKDHNIGDDGHGDGDAMIAAIEEEVEVGRKKIQQRDEGQQEHGSLLATLYFNLATALWKYSENKAIMVTNNDPALGLGLGLEACSKSNKEAIVQKCVEACRKTLDLEPTHRKALYRLCASLLLLDRAEEALAVLDTNMALSNGKAEVQQKENELLKTMRAKCVAAVMLSFSSSSSSSAKATTVGLKSSQNHHIIPAGPSSSSSPPTSSSKGAAGGMISTTSTTDDHDVSKKSTTTTAFTASALVGDRVARMMEALQARKQREKQSIAHAWNGWAPPVEVQQEQEEEHQVTEQQPQQQQEEEEESVLTATGSKQQSGGEDEQSNNDRQLLDGHRESADGPTTATATNTRLLTTLSIQETAVDEQQPQKKKNTKKQQEGIMKKSSAITTVKETTVAATTGGVKKLKSVKKKLSANSLGAFSRLKRLSHEYERLHASVGAAASISPHISGSSSCAEDINNNATKKAVIVVQSSIEAIETIWNESNAIQELAGGSLEEPLLLLLISTVKCLSLSIATTDKGRKLLTQITKCERFFTELQLAVCGDAALKASITDTLELLHGRSDGSDGEQAAYIIEGHHKFLEILNK